MPQRCDACRSAPRDDRHPSGNRTGCATSQLDSPHAEQHAKRALVEPRGRAHNCEPHLTIPLRLADFVSDPPPPAKQVEATQRRGSCLHRRRRGRWIAASSRRDGGGKPHPHWKREPRSRVPGEGRGPVLFRQKRAKRTEPLRAKSQPRPSPGMRVERPRQQALILDQAKISKPKTRPPARSRSCAYSTTSGLISSASFAHHAASGFAPEARAAATSSRAFAIAATNALEPCSAANTPAAFVRPASIALML